MLSRHSQRIGICLCQLLLEDDDEGISASFLCVDFLDLFNRADSLLSLLVADGCSEFCLAQEDN